MKHLNTFRIFESMKGLKNKEELDKLISTFDSEKSQRIDFHEFLDIMITKMSEKDSR